MIGEEGEKGKFCQHDLFIGNTNFGNSEHPLQKYIHLITVKSLFGVSLRENESEH
jgi:hypothetical protein